MNHVTTVKILIPSFVYFFMLSATIAQNSFPVGLKSFGHSYPAGWVGLRGFKGNLGVNSDKFYAKNSFLGINASYARDGFGNRFTSIYGNNMPDNQFSFNRNDFGVDFFVKFYFGESRFKPLAYTDLGAKDVFQKYQHTEKP